MRGRILGAVIVVAIAIAAVVAWWLLVPPAAPPNVVTLSGRIEGDDSAIASNIGGRVIAVRFREGDVVQRGGIIAVLEQTQYRARVTQARAAMSSASARARAARDQVGTLESQRDSALADLAQARAAYQLAEFDESSDVALYRTGDISEQEERSTISAARQAAAAVAMREAQVESVDQQVVQQDATIASAQADVAQARAQLTEAQANNRDLTVRAPFTGTIITRAVEPGEVVAAGTPVVTLLNLRKVYLRGFIPEGEIGKIKIGQAARVYLDSNPNQPLDAYVLRIDPQATFTPENTYFRSDRVREVFGVKLGLRSGFGFAKPGMPAAGEVLLGGTWPKYSPPD